METGGKGKKKLRAQKWFYLISSFYIDKASGSSEEVHPQGASRQVHDLVSMLVSLREGSSFNPSAASQPQLSCFLVWKKNPNNKKQTSESSSVHTMSTTMIYQLMHLSPSQRSVALLAAWPGGELSHSSKTRSSSLCNLSCWELTVKGHPLPSP